MAEVGPLFPILSQAKVKKLSETDRRLPTWLSCPTQFPAVNLFESGSDVDEFVDYIDEDLRIHLKNKMLIERMFPVQKCLIPNLSMQFKSRDYRRPNDICVSSPTGSGKTLAFVIPIVNHLKHTLTRSLRALVVLPTRDLAAQVYKSFGQVCAPTHLKCALATGEGNNLSQRLFRRVEDQGDCDETLKGLQHSILQDQYTGSKEGDEYVSTIDVLISTPGILVDLIHNSPGFSLRDLEILVIDEADRLMTIHKHDWLNTLERSIIQNTTDCACDDYMTTETSIKKQRICFASTNGCTIKHSHLSKPLHKLLFSATLSSDPQLLMHMNLYQPRLFLATKPTITGTKIRHSIGSASNTPVGSPAPQLYGTVNTRSELLTSSAIPDQLEEKMFITEAKEKLFMIWFIFHELKYKKVIVFTNQLQTSAKLYRFINEIHDTRAVDFSSNQKQDLREKYIKEFQQGRIDVLVSTDLMCRGMDVNEVDYVISYDMPSSEIFYVHRVGRTARADRPGTAITLVDTKQLVQFKRIVQLAHKMPNSMRLSDVVEEIKLPSNLKKDAEKYDLYLKTLGDYNDKINRKFKYMHKAK